MIGYLYQITMQNYEKLPFWPNDKVLAMTTLMRVELN